MPNTALHPKALIDRGKWKDYRNEIWGDSFNWAWVRPWNELDCLVIHHSVTVHEATPDDIALLHKARGWAGIGYHFVITKDGTVYYVGDISTARAHIQDENQRGLGILLVGDFTKHLPSDEQIKSAHDLCKYFFFECPSLPTLNNWEQLKGHKDMPKSQTACPGSSWPEDMRWRIQNRKIYSPEPAPEPTPQPQPEPQPAPSPAITEDTVIPQIQNKKVKEIKQMLADKDKDLEDLKVSHKKEVEELKKQIGQGSNIDLSPVLEALNHLSHDTNLTLNAVRDITKAIDSAATSNEQKLISIQAIVTSSLWPWDKVAAIQEELK